MKKFILFIVILMFVFMFGSGLVYALIKIEDPPSHTPKIDEPFSYTAEMISIS